MCTEFQITTLLHWLQKDGTQNPEPNTNDKPETGATHKTDLNKQKTRTPSKKKKTLVRLDGCLRAFDAHVLYPANDVASTSSSMRNGVGFARRRNSSMPRPKNTLSRNAIVAAPRYVPVC